MVHTNALPGGTTESQLILDFQSGREYAMRYIHQEFLNSIYYFAVSMVQVERDAEDIVYDGFQRLWENKETFNSLSAIKNFLEVNTRNKCINCLKARKVRVNHTAEVGEVYETWVSQLENIFIEAGVLKILRDAIESLPEMQKEVIKRMVLEEKTGEQVAKELNISKEAVWKNKERAMSRLKGVFGDNQIPAIAPVILLEIIKLAFRS